MRTDVLWTDLTPRDISLSLQQEWRQCVGPRVVRRILDHLGFARRQIAKVLPGGDSPDRDPQFRHIADLIQQFQGPLRKNNLVPSISSYKLWCSANEGPRKNAL